MKGLTYTVYETRWPGPGLEGKRWTRAYQGSMDVLNSRFPPLPHTTFIPQLERIRHEADERSERGMVAGDLIRVEYPGGGVQWWIYNAIPPTGGFEPISRTDHLALIEHGLTAS